MGTFLQVANVLVGTSEGAQRRVVEAVAAAMAWQGFVSAGEQETADRTVVISRPDDNPWSVVFDEAFLATPGALDELAVEVGRASGLVVVGATVDDNDLTELFLCSDGQIIDAYSTRTGGGRAEERRIPELWRAAISDTRLVHEIECAWLSGGMATERLEKIALILKLRPDKWPDLTADDGREGERGIVELRFKKSTRTGSEGCRVQAELATADNVMLIPSFLCAPQREVNRKWRAVINTYLRTLSWEQAVSGVEMTPINHAPRAILLERSYEATDRNNVVLYSIVEVLFETAYREEDPMATWHLMRDALIAGVQLPWFALAVLGSLHSPLLPHNVEPSLLKPVAREVLAGMMQWWDEFVKLQDRFLNSLLLPSPWPEWSTAFRFLCMDMGVPGNDAVSLDHLDVRVAKEQIWKWIRSAE